MLCIMCCIFPQSINRANSVTLGGTTYRRKDVIVVDFKDEEPNFCQIVDILETPAAECLFVTCMLTTEFFERHYYAFKVFPSSNIVVYKHYQFCDYHPLHLCKSYGTNQALYVSLKYHILSI